MKEFLSLRVILQDLSSGKANMQVNGFEGLIKEQIKQLLQCLNEAECLTHNEHVYQVRNRSK